MGFKDKCDMLEKKLISEKETGRRDISLNALAYKLNKHPKTIRDWLRAINDIKGNKYPLNNGIITIGE